MKWILTLNDLQWWLLFFFAWCVCVCVFIKALYELLLLLTTVVFYMNCSASLHCRTCFRVFFDDFALFTLTLTHTYTLTLLNHNAAWKRNRIFKSWGKKMKEVQVISSVFSHVEEVPCDHTHIMSYKVNQTSKLMSKSQVIFCLQY